MDGRDIGLTDDSLCQTRAIPSRRQSRPSPAWHRFTSPVLVPSQPSTATLVSTHQWRMVAILWIVVVLLCPFCSGQLTNDTAGALIERTVEQTVAPPAQIGQWNRLKHSSMYYGGVAQDQTALSSVKVGRDSLSSRMTSGAVSGVKMLIYLFRLIGDFLRKFGAELRVAKCLLMYSFTFQPLSSKIAGGTVQSWLAGYFGAEDARDLYRFLSQNVFGWLGLSAD